MRAPPRRYGFGALWLGQSLSLAGTQVGALALPLVAVVSLDADSGQLGVIGALRYLPFLLFALPLGPSVDRGDRRRMMLVADVARAALVLTVPVLYALGELRLWWLYVVPFLTGAFQVVFETACQAFVPQLVGRKRLTRANRNLQASQSAADLGGPGLGGLICGAVGAPVALLFDAFSFAFSAATLALIKSPGRPEARSPAAGPREAVRSWWAEVRAGLAFVLGQAELRALVVETAIFNACEQGMMVIYLVYAVRELGFSPVLLGLSLAAAGIGAMIGTFFSEGASARIGLGPTVVVGSVLGCASYLLVPAATGDRAAVFGTVCAGFAISGISIGLSNVLQVSLRQALTPDSLSGRTTASFRFVAYGTVPIGTLLGGVLGEAIGLRSALWVMSTALLLGPLAIICSPLPRRRELPATEPEERSKSLFDSRS
ncbi:MFS transporter [Kitasatospora putterlickiae]|uniref:MFS transporter n=1 Tax=Kitasatospora putterlickiae TaxID=221725 RepID=A0ABN1YGA9_9ACTN